MSDPSGMETCEVEGRDCPSGASDAASHATQAANIAEQLAETEIGGNDAAMSEKFKKAGAAGTALFVVVRTLEKKRDGSSTLAAGLGALAEAGAASVITGLGTLGGAKAGTAIMPGPGTVAGAIAGGTAAAVADDQAGASRSVGDAVSRIVDFKPAPKPNMPNAPLRPGVKPLPNSTVKVFNPYLRKCTGIMCNK